MIITIDGPAGAGKSTIARRLAQRLGYRFLDTGAMYRAVTLAALRRNVSWENPQLLVELAHELTIDVTEDRVLLDGQDVTSAIRGSGITAVTHYAADNPGVRGRLVELQRLAAGQANVVTEGRDQGTVVFPDAECKIFLTASPSERARRRALDLKQRGEHVSLAEVLQEQSRRDERDSSRAVGPLVPAPDAVHVTTDGLEPDEVVEILERIARDRLKRSDGPSASR